MSMELASMLSRAGDQGQTRLGDGARVFKNDARIEAMGTIEELNSLVGLLAAEIDAGEPLHDELLDLQNDLLDVYSELAVPDETVLGTLNCAKLEMLIDGMSDGLDALGGFDMPGGGRTVALCHVVRSVARRAERRVIALAVSEPVSEATRMYLNRLSEYFLVTARWLLREQDRV